MEAETNEVVNGEESKLNGGADCSGFQGSILGAAWNVPKCGNQFGRGV
jgi:hypothetical protein